MQALPETTAGGTRAGASKATCSPAPHQTQVGARRLLSPAVGVWRLTRQDCKLGRGDVSPVLSRISHWPLPSLAADRRVAWTSLGVARLHSPAARHSAERGAFIHGRVSDCSPSRVQLLQDQPSQYRAVLVVNHLEVLSSSLIAWFQPSEAAHGRVPKSPRAFHRKEGELPNVCG